MWFTGALKGSSPEASSSCLYPAGTSLPAGLFFVDENATVACLDIDVRQF